MEKKAFWGSTRNRILVAVSILVLFGVICFLALRRPDTDSGQYDASAKYWPAKMDHSELKTDISSIFDKDVPEETVIGAELQQ